MTESKQRSWLGQEQTARMCTRFMGLDDKGNEIVCGAEAKFHLIQDIETMQNAFCCLDHAREATERYHWDAYHGLGPCCGMPAALYSVEDNVCYYDDGLPVLKREEAVVAG